MANIQIYGIPSKEELNPILWEQDRLISKIRQALLIIAEKFYESLEIEQRPSDIRLVGSSATYAWNAKSDIDLHIIIDFKQISSDLESARNMLLAKKNLFNNEHDIKIYGMNVELYVEDVNDKNASDGIFSIMENYWLRKPKKLSIEINRNAVLKQYEVLNSIIERAIEQPASTQSFEKALKIKRYMVDMRKKGLATDKKNYSIENLVFKTLRGNGKLKKLREYILKTQDFLLSLEKPKPL